MKRIQIIGILCLVACVGCATVQPWEREGLADPLMQFEENPIEAGLQEHHIDYREGSTGATGGQGGGCGCG